ncbi:hypothetical protein [Roseinatronobacter alkalisoli]|uniref:Uncharacterized protein n=1 Tax=Roseinatronobacter alkalisoli TaxID=3028235 RepID=A0ABT5T7H6_9RHOB|nr:hypothetical protein [Roseinatronobacter sp. HJB301]MDD7971084.1 hypothetical protein [Roseinatronobacter sp. HJB301]
MQTLNPTLLRDLALCEGPLCVSLYMEMSAGGGEHDHIRIALKNAKADAKAAIADAGADAAAVYAVQQRLADLSYDDVVGGRDRRVAAFIAPDRTQVVDASFTETSVHVGTRFRLAPLLAALEQTPDHAVLVASSDRACLYRVTGGVLNLQKVADMPGSLTEISQFTDQQEKGNIHGREDSGIPASYRGGLVGPSGPAGPTGVPHHSMGGHDWREDHEQELRVYANLVINAAQRHLSGTSTPLVIAADERLYGMIHSSCEYPFLVEEGITRHPVSLDQEELRHAAAKCLHREISKRRADAWDKVAMSMGRGDSEASDNPADIVVAAAAGRVAHLFVQSGASLPGRFDAGNLTAEANAGGADDLIDRAIIETLRNGGDIFPMEDRNGEGKLMAASYRYPV